MAAYRIVVDFDLGDVACLPGTIRRAIDEQERHMRIAGHLYDEEAMHYAKRYLEQLRNCLAGIEAKLPRISSAESAKENSQ